MAPRRSSPVGLGTLRLPAVDVVVAAIDAGVDLIDTADAYGRDAADVGGAERIVAAARAARPGAAVTVVTKGGLVRRGAAWEPVGRARHLAAAAAASAARLGAPPDVYLLHAKDPRVPLATSVRALGRLVRDGVVGAAGVSNVGRDQLEEALAIAPLVAIEIELSPFDVTAVRGGVLALAAARGLRVLAHRPLGGVDRAARLGRDPALAAIAARLGATPHEVALAWVRSLGPDVVPLPGATRVDTAVSAARAAALALDDEAKAALDARWLELVAAPVVQVPARAGDVVIVMGMPAAGKSTLTAELVDRGYLRLNRDDRGGTLDGVARALDDALAGGATRVVLDNTYPTRSSRAPVIAAARRHGLPARCVWLDTPIEEAQVNAVTRMLDRHGRLLEPAEVAKLARSQPGTFSPNVQFRWRRELERPAVDEGFTTVDVTRFARRAGAGGRRALIVDLDDVVRVGRPAEPDDVTLVDGAAAAIARWRDAGWFVAATAWQPAVGEGRATRDAADAVFARVAAQVGDAIGAPGLALPVAYCPHPGGPPTCWCRKPLPGLGLVLARAHGLDLAASVHVGRGQPDRGFAVRFGMIFLDADLWLAGAPA